jgi:predicted dehydrogenase
MAEKDRGILMYDDGWHKYSVARWLFGPVREVRGWVGRTEVGPGIVIDAPSTVAWEHTSGLRGTWDVTFAPDMLMRSDYYTNDERFEVTGRKGFVRVNRCTARGLQLPSVEVYADGELRGYHALDDDWGSSFRTQTRELLAFLRTGEGQVPWSASEAREVLAFCLGALESSHRREPVLLAE